VLKLRATFANLHVLFATFTRLEESIPSQHAVRQFPSIKLSSFTVDSSRLIFGEAMKFIRCPGRCIVFLESQAERAFKNYSPTPMVTSTPPYETTVWTKWSGGACLDHRGGKGTSLTSPHYPFHCVDEGDLCPIYLGREPLLLFAASDTLILKF
jgi:hypothetical protein